VSEMFEFSKVRVLYVIQRSLLIFDILLFK